MPAYKRKPIKKRRAPRRYRRRHGNSFLKAPLPNKLATKFRYCGQAVLDPGTAGTAAVHVINAMGLYDLDYTGVGHQPRGFDELMAMYDHYQVVGAKITVSFAQEYGSNYPPFYIGIALKDTNASYSDPNDYLEGRNIVSRVMPANATNASSRVMNLTKCFSLRKFLSVTKPLSSNQYRGGHVTNPSDSAYFHIFCAPVNSGSDEASITVAFRVEYLTVMTEPRNPAQS